MRIYILDHGWIYLSDLNNLESNENS
jgi:hypothetical protein